MYRLDIQGVMLYLRNAKEVADASQGIFDRAAQHFPNAMIQGLLVQSMANKAGSLELKIAIEQDPIFGPLILLGDGDIEWQPETHAAVAIPPLNMTLARYLVIQAIKNHKIKSTNSSHQLNIDGLCQLLVRVSNLLIDCPQIVRLNIHPLLACDEEFTLLDVAMELCPIVDDPKARLAIRPYPNELEEIISLKNGIKCQLRPILPEDEHLLKDFITQVTKEDLYYRYFSEISEFTHDDLANMTQIDYDREMAFIAIKKNSEIIGVVRVVEDPDNQQAEFAVLVRSDMKGNTLGYQLMDKIIRYSRSRGTRRLTAITMPENKKMLQLAQKLGFSLDIQFEDSLVNLDLTL